MKRSLFLSLVVVGLSVVSGLATDLTVTAGSVIPSSRAKFLDGTAGATLTAGQIVYMDASDSNKIKAADANASAATAAVYGMAANGAASGQPVRIIVEDVDLTVGATLSMVTPVYVLSATAGGIAPSADIAAGWYPVVLMVAKSTTKAIFKPGALQGTAVATE